MKRTLIILSFILIGLTACKKGVPPLSERDESSLNELCKDEHVLVSFESCYEKVKEKLLAYKSDEGGGIKEIHEKRYSFLFNSESKVRRNRTYNTTYSIMDDLD